MGGFEENEGVSTLLFSFKESAAGAAFWRGEALEGVGRGRESRRDEGCVNCAGTRENVDVMFRVRHGFEKMVSGVAHAWRASVAAKGDIYALL